MEKISGVYKITNTITGDFYIGSSKDVKRRWSQHKRPYIWKRCQNNPLYLDMKKYGTDSFVFQILEEAEIEALKEAEQKFIEKMHPTYNSYNANGWDFERYNKYRKKYNKSDKYREYKKEYQNQLCSYNGDIITLNALSLRFYKSGIEHPTKDAKKYLIKKEPETPIEFYDIYP